MNRAVRILVSAAAAALLLWALAAWGGVGPRDVAHTLGRLSTWRWLAALGVHIGIYALRAQRFRVLLPAGHRPSFSGMLSISASHNLAAYVLPAKAGEATLVLYLRGLCKVPAASGLASLVLSRLMDLATLAALLALATLAILSTPDWQVSPAVGWTLVVALALTALLASFASLRGRTFVRAARALLRLVRLDRTRPGRALDGRLEELGTALAEAGGLGAVLAALPLSLAMWAGIFLFYWILGSGLGLPSRLGPLETAFGSGLAVLANVLPINALAGFGTQETGWVLGFGALGVERELALSTGLGVHLVQLFNVALMGLAGHLAMAFLARPPAEPPTE